MLHGKYADPNAIGNDDGMTSLQFTARHGLKELVEFILGEGANPHITGNNTIEF
jgi:ankyrin repeat protein